MKLTGGWFLNSLSQEAVEEKGISKFKKDLGELKGTRSEPDIEEISQGGTLSIHNTSVDSGGTKKEMERG